MVLDRMRCHNVVSLIRSEDFSAGRVHYHAMSMAEDATLRRCAELNASAA